MLGLKVRKTKNKGRGVFATKRFKKGEIIEVCPVIIFTPKEYKFLEKTVLDKYMFAWKTKRDACIPLGYGLVYNHSYSPNAIYGWEHKKKIIFLKALKIIKRGEEVTINYNWDPENKEHIADFNVRK